MLTRLTSKYILPLKLKKGKSLLTYHFHTNYNVVLLFIFHDLHVFISDILYTNSVYFYKLLVKNAYMIQFLVNVYMHKWACIDTLLFFSTALLISGRCNYFILYITRYVDVLLWHVCDLHSITFVNCFLICNTSTD